MVKQSDNSDEVILFLRQLNHNMAPIEKTIGVLASALGDEEVSRDELAQLTKKAHARLIEIQQHILATINNSKNGFKAGV